MDPGSFIKFKSLIFDVSRYEEYCSGRIISQGPVKFRVLGFMEREYKLDRFVINFSGNLGGLAGEIDTTVGFDKGVYIGNDKFLLYINPEETNSDVKLSKHMQKNFPFTRKVKMFSKSEPISIIFTKNKKGDAVIEALINLSQPERAILLYP